MFPRGPEIAPNHSGKPERSDNSEPRVARYGCQVGQRYGAMVVSGRRGDHVGGRFGYALAAGLGLEKGQYLPVACRFHRRGTALGRRASGQKRLKASFAVTNVGGPPGYAWML